jgi:outer membrane protein assembly factor BamB
MNFARRHRTSGSRQQRFITRCAQCGVLTGLAAISAMTVSGPLFADTTTTRGGAVNAGVRAEKITLPLSLNWKYTSNFTPYNPSSPAASGNNVFFAAGNRVYCVNAETGGLRWRFPQDAPMSTTVTTTPAIAEGNVYFGAADGKLYALNADTGRIDWQFDTRSNIASSPSVVDGVLYFGSSDGRVWAIDTKTHDTVSTWKGGVKMSDEVAAAPAVANGMVYAISLDQVIHAIGTATGKERWSYRLPASVLHMAPITSGEYVYIANGANIHALMARNGTPRWTQILPTDIAVSPVVTDQAVYAVGNDNRVYAYDARTGRVRWKTQPKLDYEVVAAPTVAGDLLIVGTSEGAIYALDLETGATKWFYKVVPSTSNTEALPETVNIASSPVVVNNTVYVLSDDGALSSFRSDALDSAPPVISELQPDMGIVVNGTPPFHFEAKVVDEGSGIDPNSIKISVDGQGAPKRPEGGSGADEKTGYKFDTHTSMLEYDIYAPSAASTVRPLSEGRHTVTITAADWKGNVATKSWTFTVDNSVAIRSRKRKSSDATGGPGGGLGSRGPGGSGGGSRGPGGPGGFGGGSGRRPGG